MLAFLSLGVPEILVLLVLGTLCVGAPIAGIVLMVVLSRNRSQPPPPDTSEDWPRQGSGERRT